MYINLAPVAALSHNYSPKLIDVGGFMQELLGEPLPSEEALWGLLARLTENPDLGEEIGPLRLAEWEP